MHSRVEANRKTGQRGKASRPGLTTAALTAALLASTALPSLAAIDQGVSLAVAPGIAPELTPHAPGEGQRIAAPEDRTVEHILPDGTTLTLSPGAALAVTTYRYDPGTRSGELALELGPGLFRIGGGAINNASPIALSAGGGAQACQMTLANGTAVVEVGAGGATRAYLLFGERLTISSGGATGTLVRPGFQLSSSCQGDAPEESILSETQLSADLIQLNPGLLAALAPGAGNDQDEKSDRTATIEDERSDSTPSSGGGGRQITAALAAGTDFPGGKQLGPANLREKENTISQALDFELQQEQNQPSRTGAFSDVEGDALPIVRTPRNPGLTTNRIYNSEQLFSSELTSQAVENPSTLLSNMTGSLPSPTSDLGYTIGADAPSEFASSFIGIQPLFADITGEIRGPLAVSVAVNDLAEDGRILERLFLVQRDNETVLTNGTMFMGVSRVQILESGFHIREDIFDPESPTPDFMRRELDNFLLFEVDALPKSRLEQIIDDFQEGVDASNAERFLAALGVEPLEGQSAIDVAQQIFGVFSLSDDGFSDKIDLTLVIPSLDLNAEQQASVLARGTSPADDADPNRRRERFLFAAGDVDGERDSTFAVDRFFVSPGLEGFGRRDGVTGPTVANTIRAFLRRQAAFDDPATLRNEGVELVDTGVLVVNPDDPPASPLPSGSTHTALLHADMGVQGVGANQRSTISVTIGEIRYGVDVRRPFEAITGSVEGPDGVPDPIIGTVDERGKEVVVSAHTFGSSRDNTEQTATGRAPASTFFTSKLFNTAAGGGNPALNTGVDADGDGALDPRTGRVGYLVLENFDPGAFTGFHANRTSSGVRTGGLEDPLDPLNAPNPEQQYAVLRLGTAVGSLKQAPDANLPDPNVVNTRTSRPLEGFAAGLGEYQDRGAISVVLVDAGIPTPMLKPLEPNLQVTTSAETNKVSAQLQLTGLQATEVKLGADQAGLSAFVDDDTFGARTPAGDKARGEYAMVTGLSLTTPTSNPAVRALPGLGEVPVLKHTQWGFFLGERLAKFNGRDVREHVHLGAWAAGEQLRDDALGGWAGTASYEGVAVGNVFRGRVARGGVSDGNLSTVVGSYRNRWDFGARSGSVDMSFDDRRYTGRTQLERGSARFVGDLQAAGRSGRLDGTFVGKVTDFSDRSGRGPTGLAGQFSIQETSGRDIYRATGVVAADRKGK